MKKYLEANLQSKDIYEQQMLKFLDNFINHPTIERVLLLSSGLKFWPALMKKSRELKNEIKATPEQRKENGGIAMPIEKIREIADQILTEHTKLIEKFQPERKRITLINALDFIDKNQIHIGNRLLWVPPRIF